MIEELVKNFKESRQSIEKQSEIVGYGLAVKESLMQKQLSVIVEGVDKDITREELVQIFK